MEGKIIFDKQQSVVLKAMEMLKIHQQELGKLVSKGHGTALSSTIPPNTEYCQVRIHSDAISKRDFASFSSLLHSTDFDVESNEVENALFVLIRLCDEIYAHQRKCEDILFPNLAFNARRPIDLLKRDELRRICFRITCLIKLCFLNLQAIEYSKLIFGNLLDAVPIFNAIIDGACVLAQADVFLLNSARGDNITNSNQSVVVFPIATTTNNNKTTTEEEDDMQEEENYYSSHGVSAITKLVTIMQRKGLLTESIFLAGKALLKSWLDLSVSSYNEAFRLTMFYILLFSDPTKRNDKDCQKILGKINQLQSHVAPIVPFLGARRCWIKLDELLSLHLPPSHASSNNNAHLSAHRVSIAKQLGESLPEATRRAIREASANPSLDLAIRIHRLLCVLFTLYSSEGLSLSKGMIHWLCILFEILKVIEQNLVGNLDVIVTNYFKHETVETNNVLLNSKLVGIYLKLSKSNAVITPTRSITFWILAHALRLNAVSTTHSSEAYFVRTCPLLFVRKVRQLCNTYATLADYSELVKPCLKDLYSNGISGCFRFPWFVKACENINLEDEDEEKSEQFEVLLRDAYLSCVVNAVVGEILNVVMNNDFEATSSSSFAETVLRIRFYLKLPPFKTKSNVWLTSEQVLSELSNRFQLMMATNSTPMDFVERYVERCFVLFNLKLTISPLCKMLFNDELLSNTARNFPAFASLYCYNATQEFFLEKPPIAPSPSTSSSLRIIQAVEISEYILRGSLSLGSIPTIVNAAYLCLSKKFEAISHFLFDAHVKSYMKKERKYFSKREAVAGSTNGSNVATSYSYERALNFMKDSKPLNGALFLVNLRNAITEFGNVVGFVRTIQSAYALAEKPLKKNYLQGIMDIFKQVVNSTSNKEYSDNLKSFYVIVPALCVSFVEYIVHGKFQVLKKKAGLYAAQQKEPCVLYDDGFVFGVCSFLTILNQYDLFESLLWFQSVDEYFKTPATSSANNAEEEKNLVSSLPPSSKKEPSDHHHRRDNQEEIIMNYDFKHLDSINFKKEFELLEFNMCAFIKMFNQ